MSKVIQKSFLDFIQEETISFVKEKLPGYVPGKHQFSFFTDFNEFPQHTSDLLPQEKKKSFFSKSNNNDGVTNQKIYWLEAGPYNLEKIRNTVNLIESRTNIDGETVVASRRRPEELKLEVALIGPLPTTTAGRNLKAALTSLFFDFNTFSLDPLRLEEHKNFSLEEKVKIERKNEYSQDMSKLLKCFPFEAVPLVCFDIHFYFATNTIVKIDKLVQSRNISHRTHY